MRSKKINSKNGMNKIRNHKKLVININLKVIVINHLCAYMLVKAKIVNLKLEEYHIGVKKRYYTGSLKC